MSKKQHERQFKINRFIRYVFVFIGGFLLTWGFTYVRDGFGAFEVAIPVLFGVMFLILATHRHIVAITRFSSSEANVVYSNGSVDTIKVQGWR